MRTMAQSMKNLCPKAPANANTGPRIKPTFLTTPHTVRLDENEREDFHRRKPNEQERQCGQVIVEPIFLHAHEIWSPTVRSLTI